MSDDEVFNQLLDGVEGEVEQISGDGAYDKRKRYEAASKQGAKPSIPLVKTP